MTVEFELKQMTCGHCAGTIVRAVAQVDPRAHVDVDIPRCLVRIARIAPVEAAAAALAEAVRSAGYIPAPRTANRPPGV